MLPAFSSAANVRASAQQRRELEELRGASYKIYGEADGTFTYVGYAEPVHYKPPGGEYKEIDTSLAPSTDGRYRLQNKANSFTLKFGDCQGGASAELAPLVLLEAGKASVGMSPVGGSTARAEKSGSGTVVYRDVYPGVDLRYTSKPWGVKEEIVLSGPEAGGSFGFIFALGGLEARRTDAGRWELVSGGEATVSRGRC
jgi:hypothetical protein